MFLHVMCAIIRDSVSNVAPSKCCVAKCVQAQASTCTRIKIFSHKAGLSKAQILKPRRDVPSNTGVCCYLEFADV